MDKKESLLYENEYFRIEHARAFRIPGYLFVCSKKDIYSLTDLSQDAIVSLGLTLSTAVKAVETIIKPINIYYAKFGETGHPLHFHILPRTQWLTDIYLKETSEPFVSGPLLLDWVDAKFLKGKAIINKEQEIQVVMVELKHYFEDL